MKEFRELIQRLEKFGPIYCYCCPGNISDRTTRCITFRHLSRPKRTPAGRYPVTDQFPCELCGVIKFHIHSTEELRKFYGEKNAKDKL